MHRTINLMSHFTKIVSRIIMMPVKNKIKPKTAEIAEEQCGFKEGKNTLNAIYILQTIIERALEASLTIPRHSTNYDFNG